MTAKRLLSAVLSVCLAVSMSTAPLPDAALSAPLTAAAYEEGVPYTEGIFTYFISEGAVIIAECDPAATEAVIPETIGGLPVKYTAENAFEQCSELTSVTFPASLTYLGMYAFTHCPKLREVNFPSEIGWDVCRNNFLGTAWLENQLGQNGYALAGSVLLTASADSSEMTVPEGITKIGDYAFANSKYLTSVKLPSTLQEIGAGAFMYSALTEITVPEGVTSIGDFAFQSCENLTEISLPSTLTSLGLGVFYQTPWLTAREAESDLVIIGSVLISCTAGGDVVIPETVTVIPFGALSSEITSLTIPDSVTYVGDALCSGCKELRSVTLPSHMTAIPQNFFAGCQSLTSVRIPEGVTEIGAGAFSGCSALETLELPPALKTIGAASFSNCSALREINLPEGLEVMDQAFNDCLALQEISVPDSVRSMEYAFRGCTGLKTVTVGEGVTHMAGAFSGCKSLTSLHIPASVTDMEMALSGCSALETVTVAPGSTSYQAVDNVLFTKDGSKLLFYPPTKTDTAYTVPDTVTEIERGAFVNAKALTSVTLPEKLTEIGYEAFRGCTGLTSFTVPEGVQELDYVFYGCKALETLTLPKSLASISAGTFTGTSPKDIYYAGSVQKWGSIYIAKGNTPLYQAVMHFGEEDAAEHRSITLYTALTPSVVPAENRSYQIETADTDAEFTVISGSAAEVSAKGLVKPTSRFGETIILIKDGGQVSYLHVTTADYTPLYADAKISAFLSENITDGMTDLEKLEVIGKLPASMDYNADHWTYEEMLAYNTGNCAGSATMLEEMCRRLGIKAWVRNANRDPNAGSSHVNALAEVDGVWYELEAGYNGTAPRPYTVTKRTSLYKYTDAQTGIDVYQYDGISRAETFLELPDTIDGKSVTRIGEEFLKENPWVKSVTLPDTVTEISESAFPGFDGILFGVKGSAAEEFAAAHGIAFCATGSLAPGDVNADADVNILDVIAVNKYVLGVSALNSSQTAAADVDGNAKIDSADSLLILKYALELLDSFAS